MHVRIDATITAINSSPPEQNGRHFADDIFKMHFRECQISYFG